MSDQVILSRVAKLVQRATDNPGQTARVRIYDWNVRASFTEGITATSSGVPIRGLWSLVFTPRAGRNTNKPEAWNTVGRVLRAICAPPMEESAIFDINALGVNDPVHFAWGQKGALAKPQLAALARDLKGDSQSAGGSVRRL